VGERDRPGGASCLRLYRADRSAPAPASGC
jgi:hypothetical protein